MNAVFSTSATTENTSKCAFSRYKELVYLCETTSLWNCSNSPLHQAFATPMGQIRFAAKAMNSSLRSAEGSP